MTCLDDATVLGMVEGRLAPTVLAAVDEHIDSCASCRDVVSLVAGAQAPARVLARGDTVGRYVIGELLGAGAMGRVYSAWEPELDRRVAIKVLREDGTGARDRLVREAQAMARLNHPNIVTVHEVGSTDDGVFVAMELVDGDTLRAWSQTTKPWREVARTLVEVARGLAAVHAAGVVHRDVKPDNVIIGADGRVRLGDFGLARSGKTNASSTAASTMPSSTRASSAPVSSTPASSSTAEVASTSSGASSTAEAASTSSGASATTDATSSSSGASTATHALAVGTPVLSVGTAIAGTPAYMAPEVLRGGAADAASDQFSFGVMAYELLAGRRPFDGTTWAELLSSIENGAPRQLRDVPSWLDDTIRRCLAVDPAKRFASLKAVADQLAERSARQRPTVWIAGALATALLASGATWLALGNRDNPGASCAIADAELTAIWNPQARSRLESAWSTVDTAASRGAFAAIDRWTSEWTAERKATCRAAAVEPAPRIAARERCLDQRRAELGALLERLARGTQVGSAQTTTQVGSAQTTTAIGLAQPTTPSGSAQPAPQIGSPTPQIGSAQPASPGDSTANPMAPRSALSTADRALDALASLPPPLECRTANTSTADPLPLDADRAAAAREVATGLPAVRAAIALGDGRGSLETTHALVARAQASQHAPTLAEALLAHADALRSAGQLAAAAIAARDAVAAAERGHADSAGARAWLTRVAIAGDRRELTNADDFGAIAHAAIDRAGSSPQLTAQLARLRGLIALNRGDFVDARRQLEASRAAFTTLAGSRPSIDLASVDSAQGSVARAAGDLDESERRHRAALTIDRELRGPNHPDIARDLHNIAGVLRLRGKLDEALATYREALTVEIAIQGERSVAAAITHNSIGLILLANADLRGARGEFEIALAILEAAGHGDRAFAAHNLGLVAQANGDHRAALTHFTRADAIYVSTIGAAAPSAVRLELDRARSELALGDRASATKHATHARDFATVANIEWIAEDANEFLQLRGSMPAIRAPVTPERLGAGPDPQTDAQPNRKEPDQNPAEPKPAEPRPAEPKPQPKRDVGVYGSSQNW